MPRRAVKSRRPRCWSGKGSASSVYQREGIPVSPLPRPPLPPPLNAPTPPSPLRRLPLTLPLPLATATQTGSVLIVILHCYLASVDQPSFFLFFLFKYFWGWGCAYFSSRTIYLFIGGWCVILCDGTINPFVANRKHKKFKRISIVGELCLYYARVFMVCDNGFYDLCLCYENLYGIC